MSSKNKESSTTSKKSEQEIQNEILHWLNENKIFSFRINNAGVYSGGVYRTPGKFSLKGISDIIGVLPNGKILCIEVKSESGKTSKEQEVFLAKIKSHGGISFVARSLEDVKNGLVKIMSS